MMFSYCWTPSPPPTHSSSTINSPLPKESPSLLTNPSLSMNCWCSRNFPKEWESCRYRPTCPWLKTWNWVRNSPKSITIGCLSHPLSGVWRYSTLPTGPKTQIAKSSPLKYPTPCCIRQKPLKICTILKISIDIWTGSWKKELLCLREDMKQEK